MNYSDIENLILKKLTGEIRPDEAKKLDVWRNSSEENQQAYDEYSKTWQYLAPPKPAATPNPQNELKDLKSRFEFDSEQKEARILQMDSKNKHSSGYSRRWKPLRIYAVAASVLLMIAGGYLSYQIFFSRTHIKTAFAETRQVTLPDGSTVRMNADSKISYPDKFNEDTRSISLKGEAFFEVKSSDVPFIVKSENAKIRVLGTRFNVKARNQSTTLVVEEGRVAFSSSINPDSEYILEKNEMSACLAEGLPEPIRQIDSFQRLAWLRGVLFFDEASLDEVKAELERTYDVQIDVKVNNFNESISGSFKDQSIENVLEAICLTLELRYSKKTGNQFLVFN